MYFTIKEFILESIFRNAELTAQQVAFSELITYFGVILCFVVCFKIVKGFLLWIK